jgi:hypothetical protein
MRYLAALIALSFAIPSIATLAETRVMNMTVVRNQPFTAIESHTEQNLNGAVPQKIARNSEGVSITRPSRERSTSSMLLIRPELR